MPAFASQEHRIDASQSKKRQNDQRKVSIHLTDAPIHAWFAWLRQSNGYARTIAVRSVAASLDTLSSLA